VLGIDYSEILLNKAKESSKKDIFIKGDCRNLSLEKQVDVALCLYDVIGSFADNNENIKILENIYNNLANGGYALISVMNHELTKHLAKYKFSFEKEPNKLLELVASSTMEKTGDIFNPEYYMVDIESNVVYRREQFDSGNELQKELIVRDYRYSKREIEGICKNIGFSIVMSRYVQAGRWDVELGATDKKAKEILLLCRKP
jgi:SAM-dependent methyltransferase